MPCGFDVRHGLSEIKLLTENEGWNGLPAAKNDSLYVVDANSYFSRSGPRLVDGLETMAEILHPELFNRMVPVGGAFRVFGKPF
jgi:iron complex transport system substrate-binding protein